MRKLFVVRKYILANSASEAIRLDKKKPVDDCWVDDDWKKENLNNKPDELGFRTKK